MGPLLELYTWKIAGVFHGEVRRREWHVQRAGGRHASHGVAGFNYSLGTAPNIYVARMDFYFWR